MRALELYVGGFGFRLSGQRCDSLPRVFQRGSSMSERHRAYRSLNLNPASPKPYINRGAQKSVEEEEEDRLSRKQQV